MKVYLFSVLTCLIVLFVSFYPGIPGKAQAIIKTDKQWVDEILKAYKLERRKDKDYVLTKWESKTHKGMYDFNLDIIDKEAK